ncbi:uncharacterized protein [Engystomops pustulosus]|uniref:uncharacterized protein n=1 Tax=Engystomops pustulosus TaxID=76066 RepID=UPI003AFA31D7
MEDLPRLKEKIMTYQLEGTDLGNLGYQRILLQVCGSAGHGKSSLINSFTYALHGGTFVISAPVAPAETSQGGHTMVRLPYKLTEVITLVDNRGFGKLDSFEREEVCAQLANLQPLNEVEVKWDWSYEERIRVLTSVELNTCDLLVPVFVHSAQAKIHEEQKTDISEFLKIAQNLTGFLPIVVLTKKLSGDPKTLHQQFSGMGMDDIFEVENYTKEDDLKTPAKDLTFLTILSKILDLVDFAAKNVFPAMDTPQKEHQKRLQKLLVMANANDLKREKKIWSANLPKGGPPPPKNCLLL